MTGDAVGGPRDSGEGKTPDSARALANAWLDGEIGPEASDGDAARLSDRLASDPEFAREFARLVLLHDALEREQHAGAEGRRVAAGVRRTAVIRRLAAVAAVFAMALTLGWLAIVATQPASASEIVARIVAAARSGDRTYVVRALDESDARKRAAPQGLSQASGPETRRDARIKRADPASGARGGVKRPEPPIDGAVVFIRSPGSYVLARIDADGGETLSGSDGRRAWIVPAKGPVRVSTDPQRFSGALPGSQGGVPFIDPHDGLEELALRYDLRIEPADPLVAGAFDRIIATRRAEARGGPKRLEIAFDPTTSRIHAMRLENLPQARGGPRSVEFELVDDRPLSPDFFTHQAHHAADRAVIEEN
jgi:hypothetical protein